MALPRWLGAMLIAAVLYACGARAGLAVCCPFCTTVSLTFAEEVATNDVAVIARLVKSPEKSKESANDFSAVPMKSTFEIVKRLKGEESFGKTKQIQVQYFGDAKPGATFLIVGLDPKDINWAMPIALSERGIAYLEKALSLPKEGADRLVYFQDFLEDKEDALSRDAYDEFAKAPYNSVRELKDRMHHDQLVAWINDPKTTPRSRRLYLTMLSVCGTPDDAVMLENLLKAASDHAKPALDALVAAYLTLKGPDGMELVEELYLKNANARYEDTWATIMALRFHGQEGTVIPRSRLLTGLRYILDRPKLADTVVGDLARWEDWSVIDRLVELFKNPDPDFSFVRVPVLNYLRVCPLPEAKERLDELAKLDPKAMRQAEAFYPMIAPASGNEKRDQTATKIKSESGS